MSFIQRCPLLRGNTNCVSERERFVVSSEGRFHCPPSFPPLLFPPSFPPSLLPSLLPSLTQLYQENCHEVRAILSQMTMDLPHYHNLEWRLDVQLASRSLQQQADPSLTLRLHTKDNGRERGRDIILSWPSSYSCSKDLFVTVC